MSYIPPSTSVSEITRFVDRLRSNFPSTKTIPSQMAIAEALARAAG